MTRVLPTFIAIGLILTGCSSEERQTVTRLRDDRPLPALTQAPANGQYGLYSIADPQPKVMYLLKKGDRLGFVTHDGQTFAVAGTNEVPIQTTPLVRSFAWRTINR